MKQNQDKTTAIEKALEILLCFTPHNADQGTVEISHKLKFHKATVSRILNTLTKYEFVQQNPQTKKFRLGHSAMNLGLAISHSVNTDNVVHIAKPYLDRLRNQIKETTVLELYRGGNIIMAYIAEGLGPIRIKGVVGDMRPIHASAGAKAIIAFSPTKTRHHFLIQKLIPFTPNTITDSKVLEKHFEQIRTQGFAVDQEEVNLGINAIAVPIFNHEAQPVAAVAAAGLSQEITWDDGSPIVSALKETAHKISERLYYKGDDSDHK